MESKGDRPPKRHPTTTLTNKPKKKPTLDDLPTRLRQIVDAVPVVQGKVPTAEEIEMQKVFKAKVKDALKALQGSSNEGGAPIGYNAIMKLVKEKQNPKTVKEKKNDKVALPVSAPVEHPAATPAMNPQAERLAGQLQQSTGAAATISPTYLTKDGKSWIIHAKHWWPTPSPEAFQAEWDLCPTQRHEIKVYGKTFLEKRFSQSWGFSYQYSGNVNNARSIQESTMISQLLEIINKVTRETMEDGPKDIGTPPPYNGCLQNWYAPDDCIGLHADDERNMNQEYPIWSLSWGGPRRFLLRPKKGIKNAPPSENLVSVGPVEVWLEDGDLVLMGGTCQETHKHEVPKVRKSKDPSPANRINWTIRAFRSEE